MKYPHFKGAKNYLFQNAKLLQFIEFKLQQIAYQHSFISIQTSIINHKGVFLHSLGEQSDIVNKELCYIQKKDYLLRPEGTSNVINALLQEKSFRNEYYPFKMSYIWDMFRYENPQKGRYRQFRQFGIELINKKYDIFQDFYTIQIADQCIKCLGLQDEVQLQINYIGDIKDRDNYNNYIQQYFEQNQQEFCKLSDQGKELLQKNAIKLFDTKNQNDKNLLMNLQPFHNFIDIQKIKEYDLLKSLLTKSNISFQENKYLIRGLDYYSGVCYEYLIKKQIEQSQNAILGGGRYDKLIDKITNKNIDLSCVGFALGINRILDHYEQIINNLMIKEEKQQNNKIGIIILQTDLTNDLSVLNFYNHIIQQLYDYQIDLQVINIKNFGKVCKYLQEQYISKTIIIGQNEVSNNKIIIKYLDSRQQIECKLEDIREKICLQNYNQFTKFIKQFYTILC